MGSWKNVPGTANIEEVYLENGVWKHDDKPLPESVQPVLTAAFPNADKDTYLELEIAFSSTGYYDAGKISGPPEDCYPPEGEDERTLDSITVIGPSKFKLTGKVAAEVFDHFLDRVEGVELDFDRGDEPDYPDPDEDRDYEPICDY